MNTKPIVDKIIARLNQGINTEEDCVYLLTQIRKYLEQQNVKDYWNLRMCANWSLHSELDDQRNKAVKDFIEEVNSFLIHSDASKDYDMDLHPALKYKLMFITALQQELKRFLQSLGIGTSICDDPSKMRRFFDAFGQAIEDTPLVCKTNSVSYQFDEISYSKRKSFIQPESWPPTLYWTIKKNNRVLLWINTKLTTIPIGPDDMYIESLAFITNTSVNQS